MSQQKWAFSFSDTSFKVRQSHRLSVLYKFGRAEVDSASRSTIDSIANFLNKNKNITIEIAVHGKMTGCMAITSARSMTIADTLIARGINKERISPKGYGETKPIISDLTIKKAKTKEEKDALIAKNRRTEIIILSTDYER